MQSRDPRAGESSVPAIRLRPTAPADLPSLFDMQSDPQANEMAGTKPRTREVFFSVWATHFTNPEINSRVILLDSPNGAEIVGGISRFQADGVDCVGYWIARPHWGKGIASRALQLFLAEDPRRPLHATAAFDNLASRHILEKCGFRCTGRRMGEETDRFVACEIAEFVLE
jgi:RimJ/RimL family protein N-acetyltransferase